MIITEEEASNGGIVNKFCLIGKFLTNKTVNFSAMRNTLVFLWCSVRGVCISDLSNQIFSFQFFHELDMNKITEQGLGIFIITF